VVIWASLVGASKLVAAGDPGSKRSDVDFDWRSSVRLPSRRVTCPAAASAL